MPTRSKPRRLFIHDTRLRCETAPGVIHELQGPTYDAATMLSRVINANATIDLDKWTRINDPSR
jgi:hypothetical protein